MRRNERHLSRVNERLHTFGGREPTAMNASSSVVVDTSSPTASASASASRQQSHPTMCAAKSAHSSFKGSVANAFISLARGQAALSKSSLILHL